MTRIACLAAALALPASVADARFLSVDPVAPDPGNGRAFNRYAYANNAPYTYVDPDGRVAIVAHNDDGSVAVHFPTRFHGTAATPAYIDQVKTFIGGMSGIYEVNGAQRRVDFAITDIDDSTPWRAHNAVMLVEGATPSTANGRSNAEMGGRRAEIDVLDRFTADGVPVHEFAHLGGVDDLYDHATGAPDAAQGDKIMNQVPGRVESTLVEAIIHAPTNIQRGKP
jgi:hypothetical protein